MKTTGTIIALLVALLASHAHAALVEGLSISLLSPPEFADSTVLSMAYEPSAHTLVMSNGRALLTLVEEGQPLVVESLLAKDGGPIANNEVTTAIVFDAQGRLYINDFGSGNIYRRDDDASPWTVWANVAQPRAMKFDSLGNLIVASGPITEPASSSLLSLDADGNATVIASGLNAVEDFAFDLDGDILFPNFLTGDIHRMSNGDVELVHEHGQGISLTESILVTTGGHVLLSVNLGADDEGNHNRLDRIDLSTGERIVLGVDFTGIGGAGFRLPVAMDLDPVTGDLTMTVFGSILPAKISGDLDADFGGGLFGGPVIPEPASIAVLALSALMVRRRPKRL